MERIVLWGVGSCQHIRVDWCVSNKGWGICGLVYRDQCVPLWDVCAHRPCCPHDTPSAVCLQGNRGRLGVVVAAYMHYSNISAR